MTATPAPIELVYHLYPLGAAGCPRQRAADEPLAHRLLQLLPFIDHAVALGADTLLLGPLFDSESHGYDLRSYQEVDPRLGTREDLAQFCATARAAGLRVLFDAVLNHTGTGHPAFAELREHGPAAQHRSWYRGLRFDGAGQLVDWRGWNGHHALPELDVTHPEVREALIAVVQGWLDDFALGGLRLDAADSLDLGFLEALSERLAASHPGCFLLGEVIHGDYRRWVQGAGLHSVTNYALYKALHSAANDANAFEVVHELTRQFGPAGLYRSFAPVNFLDNHDVPRLASLLQRPEQQFPLYCLMFTVPGIPSIYYGSEWGVTGRKQPTHDWDLRPQLTVQQGPSLGAHPELAGAIRRLAALRHAHPALRGGSFRALCNSHKQLAFVREGEGERCLVLVNLDPAATGFDGWVAEAEQGAAPELRGRWRDLLNPSEPLEVRRTVTELPLLPGWARVLVRD